MRNVPLLDAHPCILSTTQDELDDAYDGIHSKHQEVTSKPHQTPINGPDYVLANAGSARVSIMRNQSTEAAMGAQDDNKALVRRFYAELDAGNLEAMDELVAADFIDHDPPPIPGLAAGLEGLKRAFEIFWRSTPGTHEVLDQVVKATS